MLNRYAKLFAMTVLAAAYSSGSVMATPPPPTPPPPPPPTSHPQPPPPSRSNGGGGVSGTPEVTTGVDDDEVFVDLTGAGGGGGRSPGAPPGPPTYAPACEWFPLNQDNTTEIAEGGTTQAVDDQGRLGWLRQCDDGVRDVVYLAPAVDPATLIGPATDRARARLPLPVPIQSPAPEVGSVVNLGLWMSIEDPGVTTARASLPGAWAEVTGRFVSFRVDPGDGSDPVECDGFGVAYVEGSEIQEEGPCGYTYLQRTPDDDPHTMTYTIVYALSWRTSDGRAGALGNYERSYSFPFDIDEIQIVGTGG